MPNSPESLLRDAVTALSAEDWLGVARLCDADSLDRFKDDLLRHYTAPESHNTWSVEDQLRHSPQMPREVAEYHVKQAEEHRDPERRLREDLPGVASVSELADMAPDEVFAAWLFCRSPRAQIELAVARGEISRKRADTALPHLGKLPRIVFLGVVHDGDRIAHIVHRYGIDDAQDNEDASSERPIITGPAELERDMAGRSFVELTTCRSGADSEWRLIADHRFPGQSFFVGFDASADNDEV